MSHGAIAGKNYFLLFPEQGIRETIFLISNEPKILNFNVTQQRYSCVLGCMNSLAGLATRGKPLAFEPSEGGFNIG